MLVKLTPEEWEVLREVLIQSDNEPNIALSSNQFILEITDEVADNYRNLVQNEFEVKGLDESYEPTMRGKVLESLIDKLFTG